MLRVDFTEHRERERERVGDEGSRVLDEEEDARWGDGPLSGLWAAAKINPIVSLNGIIAIWSPRHKYYQLSLWEVL